jgi:ATP-dependent Lon protease
MGRDARGDPGAALLEVLDPAQNNKFTDHFLATPFDLSDIMFIATANSLDTIHPALLDRMEVIEISGYSLEEKLEIAKKYIVPRQIKENGITDKVIQIKEKELKQIIIEYTAESGVRNLERAIGSVCRVVAYKYAIASDPETFKRVTVDSTLITDALGNNTSDVLLNERIQTPGTAIGLAYTANGGRALLIETTKYPGSGKLILTGQLGDVMKESIGTSLSWIRSNAVRLGLVPQL